MELPNAPRSMSWGLSHMDTPVKGLGQTQAVPSNGEKSLPKHRLTSKKNFGSFAPLVLKLPSLYKPQQSIGLPLSLIHI